jgi:hypothetical protein
VNEVILLLLGIVGIFAIACSVALIALGKMIDQYPHTGDNERERSLSSPKESTMIVVILFWALFIPGGWAVLQDGKIVLIVGITTLFAICLFMFTALVFSFAVLSTIRQREKPSGNPNIYSGDTTANSGTASLQQNTPSKQYNRPVTNVMIHALLKKD